MAGGKFKKKGKFKKRKLNQNPRSDETLANTTIHKLRQSRTNPHANVRLSSKKKRKLLREMRRMVSEGLAMEVTKNVPEIANKSKEKMDTQQ